ncbi:MAG TPA: serine/threonine-protein kinase [Polyangiaceae bacterium]|jgi:serine/threonine-protein kinase
MTPAATTPLIVGRYAVFDRIAAGGMATVHLGRLVGQGGFARTVAIKRLHPQFALDPEFVAMFLDEARLAARIRHPNVVSTVDVVNGEDELFLVMEYIEGEPLSTLLRSARDGGTTVDPALTAGVLVQALHGLHAAHEATNDLGEPLHIVHRDVSPQNVLVGADGIARVIDFGVAKALGKLHTTREGQLKGKLGYLAPEQVLGHPVTRRSDVFAASVVLWEALAGRRLFSADSEGQVLKRIMDGAVDPPGAHAKGVPASLDAVVLRGLAKEPSDRFDTALAMADALEAAVTPASTRAVGAWVKEIAAERLAQRARLVASVEGNTPAPPSSSSPRAQAAPTIPDEGERAHTSISVAADSPKPAPARRWSWAWGALGGAVVVGAIVGAALSRGTGAPPTSPTTAAASAPAASAAPAHEPEALPPAGPTSSWPVAPTTAPRATVAASYTPLPRPAPTAHAGSRTARPPRSAAAPPGAPEPSSLYGRE